VSATETILGESATRSVNRASGPSPRLRVRKLLPDRDARLPGLASAARRGGWGGNWERAHFTARRDVLLVTSGRDHRAGARRWTDELRIRIFVCDVITGHLGAAIKQANPWGMG
jgi:hypothetical protein